MMALVFHLWGIKRDLPYITDDPIFVNVAVTMVSAGSLNPRWFGHPGSTVIYPLALAYRLWDAGRYGAPLLHADPTLKATVRNNAAEFHLIGRFLTVVYVLFSVVLVYQIGCDAFSPEVAIAGALFAALYPTAAFDMVVRTDGASLFFGLLSLWRCLRLLERPTLRNQLFAGGAIGLAIGTKYYLGTLVAVLATVDAAIVWRDWAGTRRWRPTIQACALGFAGIALGFAGSTPYCLLDYSTALQSIHVELRSAHIGADGLSPLGNLRWYMVFALPSMVSWYQLAPAAIGLARALWQQRPQQLILLLFVVVFLGSISMHALHWVRWLIPILPVFALLVASGMELVVTELAASLHLPQSMQRALLVAGASLLTAPLVARLVQLNQLYSHPSTGVVARQWVETHIPPGAHIAWEWSTLPMPLKSDRINMGIFRNTTDGTNLVELVMAKVADRGSLEAYVQDGYRYVVTAGESYDFYPANRARYPAEGAFYESLLTRGRLLYEVGPGAMRGGGWIRVYELP